MFSWGVLRLHYAIEQKISGKDSRVTTAEKKKLHRSYWNLVQVRTLLQENTEYDIGAIR